MDEKRLVEHANGYIKQMAKGINPLTGENVQDSDLINNVKISRCLFYVSEVLDKYTELIESSGKRNKSKAKFYAKSEDFNSFVYFNEPTYLSILTKKINELYNKDDMRKLPAAAISNWLVSQGFLMNYTRKDGKSSKKPTSLGNNLGISQVVKEGKNGPYSLNVYNREAQKFIIDNIEEISKSIQ